MGFGSAGQPQFPTPGPPGAAISHSLVVCSTLPAVSQWLCFLKTDTLPAISQSLHAATHSTEPLLKTFSVTYAGSGPMSFAHTGSTLPPRSAQMNAGMVMQSGRHNCNCIFTLSC